MRVLRRGLWLIVMTAMSLASCGQRPEHPGSQGGEERSSRVVQDMQGRSVRLPAVILRVATIDDGFVESVMTRLGTIRTLVAVGSSSQQRTWSYTFPAADGQQYRIDEGMGTMRALHPWIADLPCASRTSGDPISYETLASAHPEVVILRVGDCTVGTASDAVARTVGVLESMGIPVVVLRSPADYRGAGLDTLREEILVLGRVFGKDGEAADLARELSDVEQFVRSRVPHVPESARPRVLLLGLAARARTSGGAAYVWGRETAESWMVETVVGARNAYTGPGARVLLNAEQLLALDPDVIFLPTASGYHPPRELIEAPYFRELRRLRAVRQRRVYALAWSPMNCARRLEYPIDLTIIAKGTFPDRFSDVVVGNWVLEFCRRTYLVGDEPARLLRRGQWLEWTAESGF